LPLDAIGRMSLQRRSSTKGLGLPRKCKALSRRTPSRPLKDSLKEEAAGKGRRFDNGREAIRWLES
jgi:hypothetical protein